MMNSTASTPSMGHSSKQGSVDIRAPTLTEVLRNQAPPPYTLSAFMAFLSHNHCLETLEFVLDASRYQSCYYSLAQSPPMPGSEEANQLRLMWDRLIGAYIRPGSAREVNLVASDRDSLLRIPNTYTPPAPNALDSAVYKITELMRESVLSPFLVACQKKMREEQFPGFFPQMMDPSMHTSNQLYQQSYSNPQQPMQYQQPVYQQQYNPQQQRFFDNRTQMNNVYTASVPIPASSGGFAIQRPTSARPTSVPSAEFIYSDAMNATGSDEDANMSGSEDPMTPPQTPPPIMGTSPSLGSSLGGTQWKKTKTLFQKMGGSGGGRAKSREP